LILLYRETAMAKWFYYNAKGEKIEVTGGQLKGLAKTGMITPDTIVETEDGKTAPARRVKGLTFAELSAAAVPDNNTQAESPNKAAEEKPSAKPPAKNVRLKLLVDVDLNFDEVINKIRADIEAKNDNLQLKTLHEAAKANNTGAIKRLLKVGANVEAKDNNGQTPLHVAAESFYSSSIRRNAVAVLLHAGAKIEAKDNKGYTPLHLAAANGCDMAVTTLLKAGANVEAKDNNGFTPLHLAASGHSYKSTKTAVASLLEAGADIEAKDNDGKTPLHRAVSGVSINDDGIALLLEAGANVEAKDNIGHTPLLTAVINKNKKAVIILLEAGAAPEARCNMTTPLRSAESKYSTGEITALLRKAAEPPQTENLPPEQKFALLIQKKKKNYRNK
jgi:ankyrin repeat protein